MLTLLTAKIILLQSKLNLLLEPLVSNKELWQGIISNKSAQKVSYTKHKNEAEKMQGIHTVSICNKNPDSHKLTLKNPSVYKTQCCCSRVFPSQASIFAPASGKSFLSYCFRMNQPHHSFVPLQAWRSKHTQHQQKTQGCCSWWISGTLGSEWESEGRTEGLCLGRDDFTFSQQAPFEARTNRRGMFSLCFSVIPQPFLFPASAFSLSVLRA